jgi:hypothetical protein
VGKYSTVHVSQTRSLWYLISHWPRSFIENINLCSPGVLFPGVKREGHEADHSLISSTEVKNAWSYTFSPSYVLMVQCLIK